MYYFLNISNIKMNVYEIAQKVNDRLNDGDESKFPTTLLVVAELLYVSKPIDYFGRITRKVARGNLDEHIMNIIRIYNENDDNLESMIELQNSFNIVNHNIRKIKSQVVKILGVSTLLTGVAIGCYIIFS